MLRTLSALRRMTIHATDGEIGTVKDTLFDDALWITRYLVVDTGHWLPGRKVLISPFSVRTIDWDEDVVMLGITRAQVRSSPDIDTDRPVSRQHEIDHLDYYGYPHYWGGALAWGASAYPTIVPPLPHEVRAREERRRTRKRDSDPHLRSANEVHGYRIEALDGAIGHLDDFLCEERSWLQRYLVVDTRNWLPGRHVVVSTEWVQGVSWDGTSVRIDLSREAIRRSPEWTTPDLFTPDHEQSLYRHYGRSPDRREHAR